VMLSTCIPGVLDCPATGFGSPFLLRCLQGSDSAFSSLPAPAKTWGFSSFFAPLLQEFKRLAKATADGDPCGSEIS
jgi:hypothetical protein